MPTVTKFKCARCTESGIVDNTGTYLKVFLTYEASTNGKYTISYAREGVSTYTVVASGTGTSFNGSIVSASAILQADYAYSIILDLSDDIGIIRQTDSVPKSFVLLDFNSSGKGLAVGKISDQANGFELGMPIFDRFGTLLNNGLSFYESGGSTDPDTTLEELILTSTNTPISGAFYFIRTMFFSSKSETSNRTQLAYPYASGSSTMTGHSRSNYRRHYVNGIGWSAWIEEPVVIDSGELGIWNYKVYSDGYVEGIGHIPVSGVDASAALGNWFRTETLISSQQYAYPYTFAELPTIEMMFQTTNSSGALLWPFSASETIAKSYVPQFYLIRPVAGTNINGVVNVMVKGKI